MPYQFFFSYARRNRNDDLDRFLKDLREKVLLKKHFPDNELGFFDGDAIEAGAPWKEELARGLRTSRVLLALCSPDYINSDYCGKEFAVFVERYRAYVNANAGKTTPKLIIPVLWGAPAGSLRDVITEFQYTDDDFPAIYAQEGLRYMMELKAYGDDYTKFVNRLAHKIVDATVEHTIPDLPALRPLEEIESAFHGTHEPQADEGDRAWFVFVAAKPTELKPSRTSVDRYQKAGGRDWRPFHPEIKESVGLLAQNAAAQYGRYFTELPLGGDFLDRVDGAQATHEPVLVLVDPWTLRLKNYQTGMKKLDRHIADTCAILVPWNSPDPETTAERETLKKALAETFAYRTKVGKPLHYWGEVESGSELKTRLLEMLAYYTNKTLENTAATQKIPEDEVLQSGSTPEVPLGHPPIVENGPGNG